MTDCLECTAHRGFGFVVVQPHIGVGNPAFGNDGGRFDSQQCRARHGQLAQMNEVPVVHAAVDCRVLAHWRDDDAIFQVQLS